MLRSILVSKLISDDSFELIYNISPNNKIYFDNLKVLYPNDIDQSNWAKLYLKY